MHPIFRATFRRLGVIDLLFLTPIAIGLIMLDRWPSGWEGWAFNFGLFCNILLIVDGVGTWWYLSRQKHVSLPNVAKLVFVYGVSWNYLKQIEQRVMPQIALVKKHCPELAVSPTWEEALRRNDYVALAVMAEDAVGRAKKTIERAQRHEAKNAALLDEWGGVLRELGVTELDIALLRQQGLGAMQGAVELMREHQTLKRKASDLGIGECIAGPLRRNEIGVARARLHWSEDLLERAKEFGEGVRNQVLSHLHGADFNSAEEALHAAQNEKRRNEAIASFRVRVGVLPRSVKPELESKIAKLSALPFNSREYRIAEHELDKRIAAAE